jgi:dipeptidyl aminopeptidase/acylaminoacyl peptidase
VALYATLATAQEGRRRMKASPDAEDLARFRAISPIAHVDAVTAPLLFLLGAKDQRYACACLAVPQH